MAFIKAVWEVNNWTLFRALDDVLSVNIVAGFNTMMKLGLFSALSLLCQKKLASLKKECGMHCFFKYHKFNNLSTY